MDPWLDFHSLIIPMHLLVVCHYRQVLADHLYRATGAMGYMCDFADQTPFQVEATLMGAPGPLHLAAAVRG